MQIEKKIIIGDKMRQKATPFVKWAGGKRGIMKEIIPRLPKTIESYYEPFVGGGAVFFATNFKNSNLSDLNLNLITTYKTIKNEPKELTNLLVTHQKNHSKEYFFDIRSQNNLNDPIEMAARFIYINKTCFNGLYTENKNGECNSAWGQYKIFNFNEKNIWDCHNKLQNININHQPYNKINPQIGDFVYFDPPYAPIKKDSFTSYTKFNFIEKDQIELRDFALNLVNKGINIMISNSDTEFTRKLYNIPEFKIDIILAPRTISRDGNTRKPVKELIVTGGYKRKRNLTLFDFF